MVSRTWFYEKKWNGVNRIQGRSKRWKLCLYINQIKIAGNCLVSRVIKTKQELEVLRYVNRISSEAHKKVRLQNWNSKWDVLLHKNLTSCNNLLSSRSQDVFALLVPSCLQVWNKLLSTCNKVDDSNRLAPKTHRNDVWNKFVPTSWYRLDVTSY